jgi:transposase-like protein
MKGHPVVVTNPRLPVKASHVKAMQDYLSGTMTNQQIANKHGVKLNTLQNWIRNYGWHTMKQDAIREAVEQSSDEYLRILVASRNTAIKRQIAVSGKLRDRVENSLNEDAHDKKKLIARDLRDVSIALKNATDIESRALGIDSMNQGRDSRGTGVIVNAPMILVGAQPRIANPIEHTRIINVETEDVLLDDVECPF